MDIGFADQNALGSGTVPGTTAATGSSAAPRVNTSISSGQVPLPSPLEVAASTTGSVRSSLVGKKGRHHQHESHLYNHSSMLNAKAAAAAAGGSSNTQTVTTTTVTTTTVTTYPPLKLPRIEKPKLVNADMYPLAQMPAPPALERFVLDVCGERLFFSQSDVEDCQSEDVLGSITSNITTQSHSDNNSSPRTAAATADFQRAITPQYTQDDQAQHLLATPNTNINNSSRGRRHLGSDHNYQYSAHARDSANVRLQSYRHRRSSSPPSPDQHRPFPRNTGLSTVYSSSPSRIQPNALHYHQQGRDYSALQQEQQHLDPSAVAVSSAGANSQNTSSSIVAMAAANAAELISGNVAIGSDGNTAGHPSETSSNNGDELLPMEDPAGAGGNVLPLPSPLLSPRARPESMDTDDMNDTSDGDSGALTSRRRLRFDTDGGIDMDMSPPASGRHSGSFDDHSGLIRYVGHGRPSDDPFGISSSRIHTEDDADRGSIEEVDEGEEFDKSGAGVHRHTTTRTSRTVIANDHPNKGMQAMYNLPELVSTYDNLPANMQTFLLYQLLRRTPRPILQFAAQTMLPVLHRDFITDLPVEVSHHILKFMDTRTLCRASCVARRWQDVVNGNRKVWKARLEDARYVPDVQRVHPLCHTYFGLGSSEPPCPITCPKPTCAELDLSDLAERPGNLDSAMEVAKSYMGNSSSCQDAQQSLWNTSISPILTNPFKSQFERDYKLNRNWQEGRCKHLSFISDAGTVVTCVQLTDNYIIAGFDTKDIHVFDINTGAIVRQLVGHDGGVWALAVVGNTVISGSTDRTVRIWDLDTGKCTHVFAGHSSTVRCLQVLLPTDVRTPEERARGDPVRYEPSEPYIITGSRDTTLRVWKLPSPKKDAPYVPRTGVAARSGASVNNRQQQIVPPAPAALAEGRMTVDQEQDAAAATTSTTAADQANGGQSSQQQQQQQQRGGLGSSSQGSTDTVRSVAFRARRGTSATIGSGQNIGTAQSLFGRHMQGLHQRVDGALPPNRPFSFAQQQQQQQQTEETRPAAATPQSDVQTPRLNPYFVRVLEGHSESVRAVVGFGNMIVSGSYDFTIRIWDLKTGQCLHQLEGHTAKVYTLVLDTDLHLIFSGSMDGTIRVWNWDTGVCLRILRGHLTLVGLLAMDHNTLVSAGADSSLRIWDHPMEPLDAGGPKQRPFSNIEGDVVHNGYTPNPTSSYAYARAIGMNVGPNALGGGMQHALAAAVQQQQQQQGGNVQQMNLLQQLQMQQRANDQLHMQQIANNPDMTAATDFLRTERHVLLQHTNAITCFQHDGTKIVSGADGTVKLWDVRTGQFVRDLLSNLSGVWQVRFDKRRCVAAVHRNEVTYFEVMDFDVED
ncbi:SCF ubiquitin ligase complex subunit cdc4 [Dipsacomyces acuminosporus]|nr:SCF ubiquitin ligase complex subunit cdc4 [Dipsacomyces acuminosporus]